MHQNYNTISGILRKITKNEAVAEKAIDLWIEHGNHDSYSYNYLILYSKWAERELRHHNPEVGAGVSIDDPLHPVDIIDDCTEDKIINKISRAEKMNYIKQFGTWAVEAVEMLNAGFSFLQIAKKINIKKADLIQRLTRIAEGKGQLRFDLGGGEF